MLRAEDRLDLYDLVIRADMCATQRDADSYAALFTQNAIMDGTQGEYRGNAAICAAVKQVWQREIPGTRHVTTAIAVQQDRTSNDITVTSTLLLVLQSPPTLLGIVPVQQQICCEDGQWRISRRTIG